MCWFSILGGCVCIHRGLPVIPSVLLLLGSFALHFRPFCVKVDRVPKTPSSRGMGQNIAILVLAALLSFSFPSWRVSLWVFGVEATIALVVSAKPGDANSGILAGKDVGSTLRWV